MEYLTVEQVAERLQVSAWTVRRWLREGQIEGSHLGDRAGWRVSEGAIKQFLQARSNRPSDDEVEEGKAAAGSDHARGFGSPSPAGTGRHGGYFPIQRHERVRNAHARRDHSEA